MPAEHDLPNGMPVGVARLPRNRANWPIPWFVYIDPATGREDFRVVRQDGIALAYNQRLCWVCGQPRPLGSLEAFVIGPMCAINQISAEPPSHPQCAQWAAKACPFLANPRMVRRERGLEEHATAGNMITRNPGVALVWYTRGDRWAPFRAGPERWNVLFDIGDPVRVEFLTEGRPATREEVLASIDSGMPILRATVTGDDVEAALAEIEQRYQHVVATMLPAAA